MFKGFINMNKFLCKGGILLFTLAIIMGCMTTPAKAPSSHGKQKGMSEAEVMQKWKDYYSTKPVYHDNPEDVQVFWQDVDAFWAAVDTAKQADGSIDEKIFTSTYLEKRTGAFDKHSEFKFDSKEELYQNYPFIEYFNTFRDALSDKTILTREAYISYLQKLKEYYPEAKFPNAYFAITRMRGGGTASPQGILLFPAMFPKNTTADLSKLGDLRSKRFKEVVAKQDMKDLDIVTMHEVMHFQQIVKGVPIFRQDLLNLSLAEGTAEFLSTLIMGRSFIFQNEDAIAYAEANEAKLWQQFKEDIKTNNVKAWLYNGNDPDLGDVPSDLGYWMGFRIAKSYWDKMEDKQQAFRDILLWDDANEFLEKSGYDGLHSKDK